ncbi:hypothetical protein FQA39_LY18755 [Lamprigera yunnana]|nr:hypothetical protein FQA39_LY18755 [Lamprigera yunnana]
MSVVIETTLGDITVDLYTKERPRACLNFIKLCKIKYYNYNLFHTVSRDFIAQTGDPTGSRKGGESIYGVIQGTLKRYFEYETHHGLKHTITGLISFVGVEENMIGSQFFISSAPELTYLDNKHCVFGEVVEGLDVLELLNETICDNDSRPFQDIRITHTVILDDPYPDLEGGRIAPDEEIDETVGKSVEEIEEMKAEREAKARATILEMVGDIPDAEMAPPENVLFVCKLNPVTTDDDLEIIFSRFGKIKSCEVIRDRKTGDLCSTLLLNLRTKSPARMHFLEWTMCSLTTGAFHVDFSQSVAKAHEGKEDKYERRQERDRYESRRDRDHYDDSRRSRKDESNRKNRYMKENEKEHTSKRSSYRERDNEEIRRKKSKKATKYKKESSEDSCDSENNYKKSKAEKSNKRRRRGLEIGCSYVNC